jgi:hypothetical protein
MKEVEIKVKGLKIEYIKHLIKHLAEEHKKTKGHLFIEKK